MRKRTRIRERTRIAVAALDAACRRLLAAAAIAAAVMAPAVTGAAAQNVVVVVNGEPITAFDVDQRTRFLQLSTRSTPTRRQVIDELIDEKLKLQLVRRYDINPTIIDNQVENVINNMARRARLNQQQFAQQLASSGVQLGTLKSRVKAEIIWTQVIRGKYPANFQLSEGNIQAVLETQKKEDQSGYDYILRPILFIVPRGSPPAAFEARRREAEGLRARFVNCEEGVSLTRGLRDIAVRDPVMRSSADLPPPLREMLEKTEVGRLTPPETTLQGVELYALCAKKPSGTENTLGKREIREKLFSEQFQASAKKYLKELRSQAMIEYK